MALTQKSKAFALSIAAGKSNREAAIDAGYSEKTASQKGSALAKDPEVIAYVEKLKNAPPIPDDVSKALLTKDPMEKLIQYMNCGNPEVELEAAKAMMPYVYGKVAPKGKKEGKAEGAQQTANSGGKFGTLGSQMRS
ncbi:terminase small subunit [Acinetobacter indicus]|uniref:terminase small subunit n=1 Tax=Acinetobacter indicus TaxID=756892 RepID=UPI00126686EF|nr:terminase small subunit [Acinetobacter indicus]QFS17029.1 terminase small subunit [Acinetobacter indicus]